MNMSSPGHLIPDPDEFTKLITNLAIELQPPTIFGKNEKDFHKPSQLQLRLERYYEELFQFWHVTTVLTPKLAVRSSIPYTQRKGKPNHSKGA